MRRRYKGLLIVITVLAVTLSGALIAPPARAVAMTTSEDGIAFIKDFEGFRSNVYWDSGSAFIGYGTICRSSDYPNGITKEKADELMREALHSKEESVNKVFAKYNVQLTQNQFDAIMSFTYNLGTAWMNSGTRIYNYLINGIGNYSDIQIVNAIGTWCHQGKAVNEHLVDRRIREAKLFLYGDYAGVDPHAYRYLTFDAGEGVVENSIEFFELGTLYGDVQTAALDGRVFAGWITENGNYITPYMAVEKNMAVSAVWSDGTQPVQNKMYPDVSEDSWYYTYVKELSSKRVVNGYPDGSFRPSNAITAGEALKLILRAVGFEEQPPVDGNWASGYLRLAISKGIVNADQISDLSAPITRLLIAQITAKALGLPAIETQSTFADTSDGLVLALYYCKIIEGNNDAGSLLYRPQNNMTRAEISTVVWKIGTSNAVPF